MSSSPVAAGARGPVAVMRRSSTCSVARPPSETTTRAPASWIWYDASWSVKAGFTGVAPAPSRQAGTRTAAPPGRHEHQQQLAPVRQHHRDHVATTDAELGQLLGHGLDPLGEAA